MATTTMEQLCSRSQSVPAEDQAFYARVIEILERNYPRDWKSWEIKELSYVDLFGDQISSKVEAKLRFAIPTMDLAKAFSPEEPSLSEKKYRCIKRKLLEWPLGRALLYSPHSIAEKIHENSYDEFFATVKMLKSKLTSRDIASSNSRKRRSTSRESASSAKIPCAETNILEKMMEVLSSQTKAIENVAEQVKTLSSKSEPSEPSLVGDFESIRSSSPRSDGTFHAPSFCAAPSAVCSQESPDEATLTRQIAEAQRKLAELSSSKDFDCDFTPKTVEAEPKLSKADPDIAAQGRNCQRLGSEGWKNIRYAEVQKTFHATPVFGALKVNSILASNTPSWMSLSQLEKTDLTLGAISHGLLLQRKAFTDACKGLDSQTRKIIQEKLLGSDCQFRKLSDGLLQYTCGRRAEVIQTRRETYKPTNKVLSEILHEIPPSETHLFSEEKLTEIIKDQGGAYKFFPKKANSSSSTKQAKKTYPLKNTKPSRDTTKPQTKKPFHGTKNFRSKQQQDNYNRNKASQSGSKKH